MRRKKEKSLRGTYDKKKRRKKCRIGLKCYLRRSQLYNVASHALPSVFMHT
jgi:hypothetical protein